jgi:hypothetical protein
MVFHGFVYDISYAMTLLDCRMSLSEPELMLRYSCQGGWIIIYPFEDEFLQDFLYDWQETDWSI